MKKFMTVLAIISLATLGFAQTDREDYNGEEPVFINSPAGPIWGGPNRTQVLYDNGPLVNSAGTGAGGADQSVVQSGLGMSTLGLGHQVAFDNRIADDFTIPAGEAWTIETITFFAYQTNAPSNPSPFVAYNVDVWDGTPPAASVIATGTTLDSTTFTNIYRVTETTLGASNRAIFANVVSFNPPLVLTEGTYWLDWQADGSGSFSGPWAPPITIAGQTSTGNALQSVDGGGTYNPANDSGTGQQQGFPFIIEGSPACDITSMDISGVDYEDDLAAITLYGECSSGVNIVANATGATVASGVTVSGSTTIYVDLVLDSTYSAVLDDGTVLATTLTATVPTLGEWGMIAFLTLLTGAGLFFMRRRRLA